MAKKLTELYKKNDMKLSIETNTSRGELVIFNPHKYSIGLDLKLQELFDIDTKNVS